MNLNIYEIIILILLVFDLGVKATNHGKVETKRINFWIYLLSSIITVWLFYMAGLFH